MVVSGEASVGDPDFVARCEGKCEGWRPIRIRIGATGR
jgi:hypothetical protein